MHNREQPNPPAVSQSKFTIGSFVNFTNIPIEATQHYESAQEHERQGHNTLALKEYQKAIEVHPTFAEAYFNLGVLCQTQSRTDLGITSFTKALKHGSKDLECYYRRGCLYLNQRDYISAAADFSTCISHKPSYHNAYLKLAETHEKNKDIFSAITAYINGIKSTIRSGDPRLKNRLLKLIPKLSTQNEINAIRPMIEKLDTDTKFEINTSLDNMSHLPLQNQQIIDSASLLGIQPPSTIVESSQTQTTTTINLALADSKKEKTVEKRKHDQISQTDVVIKEDPLHTQPSQENDEFEIRSIRQLNLIEAAQVVKTLVGKSKAKYNCPQKAFGVLKYLLTSEVPTAPASTRPATSKDIQIDSFYRPIKEETHMYAQVSSLQVTHTGAHFPAPHTSETHYEETQNGEMALDISLEKYVIDSKNVEKVHYKKLNELLITKASLSRDKTTRGLLFLTEKAKTKYALVFMTTKDKPDTGQIEFSSQDEGFAYRFTKENGQLVTGTLSWELFPTDMVKDNDLIYNYQFNILKYVLTQFVHLGYIRSIQMPDLGKYQGHQIAFIANEDTVSFIDCSLYRAASGNIPETPVEEYILSSLDQYFESAGKKYSEDVYCLEYPASFAKKNKAVIKQESIVVETDQNEDVSTRTTTTHSPNPSPRMFNNGPNQNTGPSESEPPQKKIKILN